MVSPVRVAVKMAVYGVATYSQLHKKFKMQPSAGKVICTVFWDRKGTLLLDFLEALQTVNSDPFIVMLTKLKAQTFS